MSTLFPLSRRRGLTSFNRDFNDVFSSFFGPSLSTVIEQLPSSTFVSTPRANIDQTDEGYIINLAAPGFSRDDFSIDVENNVLTISVIDENAGLVNKTNTTLHEYSYSSFTRSWTLPEGAQIEVIGARYEAGILEVNIPIGDGKNSKKLIVDVK
ncbi:MAG TPA: Hsp20/alpha crystallin family protein [Pseudomonadales bacterium]|nr:Hsp20/alpha crystallin family protein [Pseudomonadales bacterium]